MILPRPVLAGLAALTLSAPLSYAEPASTIGGVGLQYCANVTGPGNVPNLAEAVDWALGYYAGRIDSGQVPAPAGPETADPLDAAAMIVSHCRKHPDDTVLEAVRQQSVEVFATHAAPQAPLAEDLAMQSAFEMPAAGQRPRPRPQRQTPETADATPDLPPPYIQGATVQPM
jgi:hypothetical protein